jgi:hypothetical protein
VAQVRQATTKFSEPVVAFRDLRVADPFAIACWGGVAPSRRRSLGQRLHLARLATKSFSPAPSGRCKAPAEVASTQRFFASIPTSAARPAHHLRRQEGLGVLDGKPLGSAERWRWAPWPGRHRLTLLGADRQPLQSASFDLRGAARKAGAANR